MKTSETNDIIQRFIDERMRETNERMRNFDRCRIMHAEILKRFGGIYADFFVRSIFLLAMAYPKCSEQELLVKLVEHLPNPDAN